MSNLIYFPKQELMKRTDSIIDFDDGLLYDTNQMIEKLQKHNGLGIAANQLGAPYSVIAVDIGAIKKVEAGNKEIIFTDETLILCNPRILMYSDEEVEFMEGCLSFPGLFLNLKRAKSVHVEYQDIKGNTQTIKADGLLAIVLQHEIDHLEGIVFVDHLSKVERNLAINRFKQIQKKQQRSKK